MMIGVTLCSEYCLAGVRPPKYVAPGNNGWVVNFFTVCDKEKCMEYINF